MPITLGKRTATFKGNCTVEEAEALLAWLEKTGSPRINLGQCEHVHSAVVQALLAARPTLAKAPKDPFLAQWVAPLLETRPTSPQQGDTP